MSPTGKFTLRLVIYGAFLLYLVGDLFTCTAFWPAGWTRT